MKQKYFQLLSLSLSLSLSLLCCGCCKLEIPIRFFRRLACINFGGAQASVLVGQRRVLQMPVVVANQRLNENTRNTDRCAIPRKVTRPLWYLWKMCLNIKVYGIVVNFLAHTLHTLCMYNASSTTSSSLTFTLFFHIAILFWVSLSVDIHKIIYHKLCCRISKVLENSGFTRYEFGSKFCKAKIQSG